MPNKSRARSSSAKNHEETLHKLFMAELDPPPPATADEISGLARLWILRMLVPLDGHKKFVRRMDFLNDTLAEALGLGRWVQCDGINFDRPAVLKQLREMHREAEARRRQLCLPRQAAENVAKLASLVGLKEADCRILEFAACLHNDDILSDAAEQLGDLTSSKLIHILSIILALPEKDVCESLSWQGILSRSGLVTIDREGTLSMRNKLNLLTRQFADTILHSDVTPLELLREIVIPSKRPTLSYEDFQHIDPSLRVLRTYLLRTLELKRTGVNILFYGDPGTGKTELSRLLAEESGSELFEVTSEGDDGRVIDGKSRLRAYGAAQTFFANRRAVILFDEVEDIFDGGIFDTGKSPAHEHKAWINRILEENKLPAIWITNSIRFLDRAFIRRFDMAVEFPIPPLRQRERIVRTAGAGLLPESSIRRIAQCEHLAPAIVTRAAAVAQCLREDLGDAEFPAVVEQLIGSTLSAQGHKALPPRGIECKDVYDPVFISADADLAEVTRGLEKTKAGRLCLYGPSGTGKTAYGRWLADQIGVPLCLKKSSDLLSMFVGGTERNIAQAFREAERGGALLLIDEVDSFLRDRRQAVRSWEVTGVNEMLTQMESFPGVFIASTNLMDGIDQAALRRFDLKVRFDFLNSRQAWELLKRYCVALGLPAPGPKSLTSIERLTCLTPGDFAAVARQHRFNPLKSADAFCRALEKECLAKEATPKKAIGF